MRRHVAILLVMSMFFIVAGCSKKDTPISKVIKTKTNVQNPTNHKKALLVIDNYTTAERTIYNTLNDPVRTEFATLAPFQILEIEIEFGQHQFEVTPRKGILSYEMRIDVNSDAIYVWDLAGSNKYVTLLLSADGISTDKVYQGASRGLYKTNANVPMLQPMMQLEKSVYRLFKDMPEDKPMTIRYAKKIAYEMPQAFTVDTLARAVKTLASDHKGKALEDVIFPLFESNYPALFMPAGDLLSQRGSKEFGNKFLELIAKGWARNQSNLKRFKAIHIIAGCAGIEGLTKLWKINDDDGRTFIFNALTRSNLDASVEFTKQLLQGAEPKYKQAAFNYLILLDFIYKPGVYEVLRDFAKTVDQENPSFQLLKQVIKNASSVIEKFDEKGQIAILLDCLRFPDSNTMRFGLQTIIGGHGDEGLKAFTDEYLSLPEQLRIEAVNQIIYKYRQEPNKKVFVDFLKLVIEEDSIDARYSAAVVLSNAGMLEFDPSLLVFMKEIVKNEPEDTKAKFRAAFEKGYAEYLIKQKYDKDIEIELKKLVKSGAIDAAITALNYLKLKLDDNSYQEFLQILQMNFDKYPINNRCVLLDKFARELSEAKAKEFIVKSLKDESFRVRTVAFDRLILNPKYANDEEIIKILNDTYDAEKDAETKKYFSRTLLLTKINSEIMDGITNEILSDIDRALASDDEILVQKTVQIIHGFEDAELLKLLVKHFSNFPQKQRVQVADFMARYKNVDFAWVEKTAKDDSPAVRQALFFALISRLKTQPDEETQKICERMIEDEKEIALKKRFQKNLAEIK